MVETKRAGTTGSVIMLVLVPVVVIAAIALLFLIPGALESLVIVLMIIVGAIAVLLVAFVIITVVLAIPMYAYKGEEYQTDISYSIDDVESVKETSSEENKAQ